MSKALYKKLYKQNKKIYGELHPYVIWLRVNMSPFATIFYILFSPIKVIKRLLYYLRRACLEFVANRRFNAFLKNNKGRKVSDFIKPIALYLPQYHEIPENNEWWGQGFTEWTNVRKAQPLFEGHYQPHVPHRDIGYYDLSDVNVMRQQVQLAQKYGVYGFCFYYYHFAEGKRLLETPINNWLNAKDIDFPFCFAWANENWTRSWDGGNKQVIMPQDYDEQNMLNMLQDMLPAFQDKRYIKIDNKPLLLVYRAEIIPQIKELSKQWRNIIKENGFDDIYLVSMQNFAQKNPYEMGFDAAVEFAPQALKKLCNFNISAQLSSVTQYNATVFHMDEILNKMIYRAPVSYPRIKCVCPSWDNSPRRGSKSPKLVYGATPAAFNHFVQSAIKETLSYRTTSAFSSAQEFLFINAWNEWGEGAHLEPDEKYGYAWLEIINNIQNQPIEKLTTHK